MGARRARRRASLPRPGNLRDREYGVRGARLLRPRGARRGARPRRRRRVPRPARGRRPPAPARRLDPGLCQGPHALAPAPPLLRALRGAHREPQERPRAGLHRPVLRPRAFPAHRPGGHHAGARRRILRPRPAARLAARHALHPGRLRRAGREPGRSGRPRGARGSGPRGPPRRRPLQLLPAVAVPGLAHARLRRPSRAGAAHALSGRVGGGRLVQPRAARQFGRGRRAAAAAAGFDRPAAHRGLAGRGGRWSRLGIACASREAWDGPNRPPRPSCGNRRPGRRRGSSPRGRRSPAPPARGA